MRKFAVTLILLTSSLSFATPQVAIDVKLSPAGSFKAETKEIEGFATLKNGEVEAKDVSVNLSSLKTGLSLRDDHMKNKYLDVKKNPKATLTLGRGKGGVGEGKLKVKDIEKPIKGTYQIKGNELEAKFEVKLSDYGITGIKYFSVGVNDLVHVTATIPLKK